MASPSDAVLTEAKSKAANYCYFRASKILLNLDLCHQFSSYIWEIVTRVAPCFTENTIRFGYSEKQINIFLLKHVDDLLSNLSKDI